jgi:hypothetical protein
MTPSSRRRARTPFRTLDSSRFVHVLVLPRATRRAIAAEAWTFTRHY